MNRTILAKLHDLLKLSGDSQKHFCPEWADDFEHVPTDLKKFLKHHCVSWYWTKQHKPGCSPFAIDAEMLCTHLADVKAATISRKLRTSKYRSYRTFRVWRDTKKSPEILEKEKHELAAYPAILMEIGKHATLDDLYARFQTEWLARSEDAGHCPFASLNTHNLLTATWFEFFLNNRQYFQIPDTVSDAKELRNAKYAFSRTRIAIVRMKLRVNTKLGRLRDAKLIKDVPDILCEIASALSGKAVYILPEEVLMVTLPGDAATIGRTVQDTLKDRTNYYLETSVVETMVSNRAFLHNYNPIFGDFQRHHYPRLDKEITVKADNEASHRAIICDMCQMAPATTVYPRQVYGDPQEIEPVEEFLCDGCLRVRQDADRAKTLAKWEDEEGVSVAFFKITIEMPELVSTLKAMFAEVFGFKTIDEEDLGFSILDEFIGDYARLLDTFKRAVFQHEAYGQPDNYETILDNLFCVKVRRNGDIKPLVDEYVDLLTSTAFFSQMVDFAARTKRTLPVRLSTTVSSVKYPFMEHWQTLNDPRHDINVFAAPGTRLGTSVTKYLCLRGAGIEDKRVSSALHKLAKIEERTDNRFIVTAAMLEMKNDLKGLAKYLITTNELSIDETLAYYKIMRSRPT